MNDGLLNTLLVPVRHNEPEGSARLGALSEDGHFLRFLQSAAAHRQRLLQGDIILCFLPHVSSVVTTEMGIHESMCELLLNKLLRSKVKLIANHFNSQSVV